MLIQLSMYLIKNIIIHYVCKCLGEVTNYGAIVATDGVTGTLGALTAFGP